MYRLRKVKCANCKKSFYKNRWHVEENLRLGYNFYCSLNCLSEHKRTGKRLICENDLCRKEFYREKHAVLQHNYCSQSCAAVVNNYKFPRWPARYCKICKVVVKREGTPYCSIECGKIGRFKYTKKEILRLIKKYHNGTGRIPAKREVLDISNKAVNLFGSWNNAIIAAGLMPNRSHDHRMYKRVATNALDGHTCDSISEAIIDNWLTEHHVTHQRDVRYPKTNHLADWSIEGNVFIEYFGLANDSPRYDRAVRKKRNLCRRHGIKLVEIYPQDLYPKVILDDKFKNLASLSIL